MSSDEAMCYGPRRCGWDVPTRGLLPMERRYGDDIGAQQNVNAVT